MSLGSICGIPLRSNISRNFCTPLSAIITTLPHRNMMITIVPMTAVALAALAVVAVAAEVKAKEVQHGRVVATSASSP
jgi:hypothetical protein